MVEVVDLISLWRRQHPAFRGGEGSAETSGVRTYGMHPRGPLGTRESRSASCQRRDNGEQASQSKDLVTADRQSVKANLKVIKNAKWNPPIMPGLNRQ